MASDGKHVVSSADRRVVIGSYLAVILAIVVIFLLERGEAPAVAPLTDFSKFAIFYVVAQAIERLLEPATKWADAAKEDALQAKSIAQAEAAEQKDEAVQGAIRQLEQDGVAEAKAEMAKQTIEHAKRVFDRKTAQHDAVAAGKIKRIRSNTRTGLWATATIIAMFVSALLNLFLLRSLGVTSAPPWLDVVVTGFAIGAGTQPLHELISRIERRSNVATGGTG